jgi:hypothetical protein
VALAGGCALSPVALAGGCALSPVALAGGGLCARLVGERCAARLEARGGGCDA